MKLPTLERGEIIVLAISVKDGKWEPDWEPIRGTAFGDQITVVSRETLDHALHGFSRPLSRALGIPPAGALKKVPKASRQCYVRSKCPFVDPRACRPEATKMPWCFEPDGFDDENVRRTATQAIEQWREGVYVLAVTDA
jgi:hypothetical protein